MNATWALMLFKTEQHADVPLFDDCALCVHGRISTPVTSIEQIRMIIRLLPDSEYPFIGSLVWSDPSEFGATECERFVKNNWIENDHQRAQTYPGWN
jgi:hypothetical protein